MVAKDASLSAPNSLPPVAAPAVARPSVAAAVVAAPPRVVQAPAPAVPTVPAVAVIERSPRVAGTAKEYLRRGRLQIGRLGASSWPTA